MEAKLSICSGPTNPAFVDAALSHQDILVWGYTLQYNQNGVLWRVDPAGRPHPDDYHQFLEQNRVIQRATERTIAEMQPLLEIPQVAQASSQSQPNAKYPTAIQGSGRAFDTNLNSKYQDSLKLFNVSLKDTFSTKIKDQVAGQPNQYHEPLELFENKNRENRSGAFDHAPGKQYVTAEQLQALGMKNINNTRIAELNQVLERFEINSPARIRHFLAQCAKESDWGEGLTEYGNKQYWIDNYWNDEERRGWLGNLSSEDAVKFRGAGYIQVTGRYNYQKFADFVGDPKIMEEGAEYVAAKYPWLAAGVWWEKNNMNTLVDSLEGTDPVADVNKVTDVVKSI